MRYLIFIIVLFSSPLYAQDLVSPLPETLEVQETSANVTTVDEKQTYETLEVQEASAEVTTLHEKHTVVAYCCGSLGIPKNRGSFIIGKSTTFD